MNAKEIAKMAKLETKVDNIETKQNLHCKEQREDFNKVFNMIALLPEKMDQRYAKKEEVQTLKEEIKTQRNEKFQWKHSLPGLIIATIAIIISLIG